MLKDFYTKLSDKEKKVFYVAIGMVVLALFDTLFMRPVFTELSGMSDEIEEMKAGIRSDELFLLHTDDIRAEEQLYQKFDATKKGTEDELTAGFLETVELLASESRINLVKLHPAEVVPKKGYILYYANLESEGKLSRMIEFMHRIGSTGNLLRVAKINLSGKKTSPDEVTASMKISKLVIDPASIGEGEALEDENDVLTQSAEVSVVQKQDGGEFSPGMGTSGADSGKSSGGAPGREGSGGPSGGGGAGNSGGAGGNGSQPGDGGGGNGGENGKGGQSGGSGAGNSGGAGGNGSQPGDGRAGNGGGPGGSGSGNGGGTGANGGQTGGGGTGSGSARNGEGPGGNGGQAGDSDTGNGGGNGGNGGLSGGGSGVANGQAAASGGGSGAPSGEGRGAGGGQAGDGTGSDENMGEQDQKGSKKKDSQMLKDVKTGRTFHLQDIGSLWRDFWGLDKKEAGPSTAEESPKESQKGQSSEEEKKDRKNLWERMLKPNGGEEK